MPDERERKPVIAIDASRANAKTRTGVEWYAYHVIQGLKEIIPDDYRVVLYSREPLRDGLETLPPHWEHKVLEWRPKRFWTQIRLSWEVFRHPPDLLFVPAHVLPAVLPKRSVTTVHDVAFMERGRGYSPHGALYLRMAAYHAAHGADLLLTVSEFSKREILKALRIAPDDVRVTHLGYDAELFGDVPEGELERVRAKYGLAEPYFLFVGRLETKKNIEGMLAAFAEFRKECEDAELVLVGKRGRGGYAAMTRLEARPEAAHVHELGYAETCDLPGLYAAATALLFPSRYEGFGIPAIESMACGTPVIASDTTSLPEVCGPAGYYVNPDDVGGIAEAMCRMIREPSLRKRLSVQGKERAAGFRWEDTARRTWEALRDVIEK